MLFCAESVCLGADSDGALKTVRDFYVRHFNYDYHKTPNIPAPEIEFSTAFKRELKVNKELCAKYGDEICGFAADGDPYTDSQDSDDNLNAQKAKLQVTKEKSGLIRVTFNLFPEENSELKVVKYKMVQEKGKWLVDDIFYSNEKSAREQIREENEYNLKQGPENLKYRKQQENKK